MTGKIKTNTWLMEEKTKTTSNIHKKVKSASSWSIGLGALKLLLGFIAIFTLGSMVGEISGINAISIILTLIVGGLMVFWGLRIRENHPNTFKYITYLIVLISISLILGLIARQGPKILINGLALYFFIRARNHLKTDNA